MSETAVNTVQEPKPTLINRNFILMMLVNVCLSVGFYFFQPVLPGYITSMGISITVAGIIAGTNTIHNAEPDASEPFLQSGKLVSYMYSQSHNRDLLKRHDPGKDYNVFWELLLSSQTPQFEGFYEGAGTEEKDVSLCFGKSEPNQEGIAEIQKGILDFADEYMRHFGAYPYMLNISGRDAYAPMLAASGQREKYLKAIEKRFHLEIGV